jgi:hypothetical protein
MNKDEEMRKKSERYGNSAGTTWSALDEIIISPFVSKVKLLPGAKHRKQSVWLSTVMRDYIQPTARKLGIQKKMSRHTFDTHFPRFSRAIARM